MSVTSIPRVFMPFKSQAQRRKFAQLLVEGKISNQTFEEWNRETGGKTLPERVAKKKTKKRATKKRATKKTAARKAKTKRTPRAAAKRR